MDKIPKLSPLVVIIGLIFVLGLGLGLFLVLRTEPLSSTGHAESKSGTPPTPAKADLNGDGLIDNTDAAIWQKYFREKDPRGDLNGDGKVSSIDFQILRQKSQPTGP